MGYLNNSSIVIDAVLTKKGRELLARGQNEFRVAFFALSDDEVDYSLWNSDHPLGSAYYGRAIENLPITEAVTDETQVMKYPLVTLPKNTVRIPVVAVSQTAYTFKSPSDRITITPSTTNFPSGNAALGYTAVLSDSDAATFVEVTPTPSQQAGQDAARSIAPAITDLESSQTVVVTGTSFVLSGKFSTLRSKSATLTIIGNETGGRVSIDLTINRLTTSNSPGANITT
jgi:hypothetical protein